MKALKKAFAMFSSIVLAFALMVPTLAFADGEESNETNGETSTDVISEENKPVDLDVRVTYANTPIILADLDKVPHSISITFKPQVEYAAYSDKVTYDFTLNDDESMKKLRIDHSAKNADGSFTVTMSNGNEAIPMTNGLHLDLGTLDVKINDNFNPASPDAIQMLAANIQVTSLDTSDDTFVAANSINSNEPKDVNFGLVPSSTFASVADTNNDPNALHFAMAKVSVPEGVAGPSESSVYESVVPIANDVLTDLWEDVNASPEMIYGTDLAAVRTFIRSVQDAGLSRNNITVTPILQITPYESIDSIPADQKEEMIATFGSYSDQLGFYDISIFMNLEAPSIKDVTAALKGTSSKLQFTFSVPEGVLYGKAVAVGYVHDGEAKRAELSANSVDAQKNTVTFSTDEFSTYGIFATAPSGGGGDVKSGSDAQRNGGNAGAGLATTGDSLTIAALLIGIAILAGAGAGIVMWRKRHVS